METGALLYDPATDKVGEYQDKSGPYALLRPVGGGREWQADPASLRPATDQERLSAEVRAANARARTDGPFLVAIPPRPVADCPACTELAGLRATARTEQDYSAETDANVLLRKHQIEAHPG
ncbi:MULTISPECIES: hypothetical protein [unclassified Streptomyces]|uniref:hypothetical protein n=1 Tax=unclassified Streptomyces TaxID=2593676 RepID=UPI001909A07C|nr:MULTISPECIES: hypothetical protein [unclassified Streptomyces]MBK3571543.1 hypothetical protein [Streptomyces sp. MBT62]MBK6015334.1 hypothetical protein [Streptomyces sp. MBT53]